MTNGDKTRQMSDDEIALMFDRLIQDCEYCPLCDLCTHIGIPCKVMYLKWLQEEVQEDG